MTKIDDFQTKNLSSVGRILGTQTSKWGGRYDKKWRFSKEEFEFGWPDFRYTELKMRGTTWQKVTIFKREVWVRLAGFEVHKFKEPKLIIPKMHNYKTLHLCDLNENDKL